MSRQEWQVGTDLINAANRGRALLRNAAFFLKDQAPDGSKFRVAEAVADIDDDPVVRDATVDDLKAATATCTTGAGMYCARVSTFLGLVDLSLPANGLAAHKTSISTLNSRIVRFQSISGHVATQAGGITNKQALAAVSNYVNFNLTEEIPIPEQLLAPTAIRTINVINDVLDVVSWELRGLNGNTGGELRDKKTLELYSFEQLKSLATTRCRGMVSTYPNEVHKQLHETDEEFLEGELAIFGESIVGLESAANDIFATASYVLSQLRLAAGKPDLITIADYIDARVPKLLLIRRTWPLEA